MDYYCLICYTNSSDEECMVMLECTHMFCRDCFGDFISTSKTDIDQYYQYLCPIDKKVIRYIQYLKSSSTVTKAISEVIAKGFYGWFDKRFTVFSQALTSSLSFVHSFQTRFDYFIKNVAILNQSKHKKISETFRTTFIKASSRTIIDLNSFNGMSSKVVVHYLKCLERFKIFFFHCPSRGGKYVEDTIDRILNNINLADQFYLLLSSLGDLSQDMSNLMEFALNPLVDDLEESLNIVKATNNFVLVVFMQIRITIMRHFKDEKVGLFFQKFEDLVIPVKKRLPHSPIVSDQTLCQRVAINPNLQSPHSEIRCKDERSDHSMPSEPSQNINDFFNDTINKTLVFLAQTYTQAAQHCSNMNSKAILNNFPLTYANATTFQHWSTLLNSLNKNRYILTSFLQAASLQWLEEKALITSLVCTDHRLLDVHTNPFTYIKRSMTRPLETHIKLNVTLMEIILDSWHEKKLNKSFKTVLEHLIEVYKEVKKDVQNIKLSERPEFENSECQLFSAIMKFCEVLMKA